MYGYGDFRSEIETLKDKVKNLEGQVARQQYTLAYYEEQLDKWDKFIVEIERNPVTSYYWKKLEATLKILRQ